MSEDLKARLHQYYEQQKIAVRGFQCPNSLKCEEAAAPEPLTGRGSEAHVGSCYRDPFGIVVVSLDRGEGAEDVWSRSANIEHLPTDGSGLNAHMRGTLATLRALLPPRYHADIWSRFAMTNGAKCCYGNMDTVPEALFWACSEFALQELILLKPQVVVTQGKNAREPLKLHESSLSRCARFMAERYLSGHAPPGLQSAVEWMIDKHLGEVDLDGTKCLWLRTPHPSDRAGRWHPFCYVFLPVLGGIIQAKLSPTR